MAAEMHGIEGRVRRLEEEILRLQKRLASDEHKLNQVSEDQARQFQPEQFGRIFTRGQSVGIISGRLTNSPGTGTFRFIQLIGTQEYLLRPFAMGDVTAPCVNDTGSPTIDNEYLELVMIDGVWTAIVGDCTTVSPTRAPDPPA